MTNTQIKLLSMSMVILALTFLPEAKADSSTVCIDMGRGHLSCITSTTTGTIGKGDMTINNEISDIQINRSSSSYDRDENN